MKIHNPHDALIKELLASKENAIDFVKQFLPEEISRLILFESITQTKDSFITEELKEYFSDILFENGMTI